MIHGTVEGISRIEISGWVFDPQCADDSLLVEAFVGDKLVGTVFATMARSDLREAARDRGNHAFSIRMRRPLAQSDLKYVSVHATSISGERAILPRSPELPQAEAAATHHGIDEGEPINPASISDITGKVSSPAPFRPPRAKICPVDLFVHIPKSAGSTVRSILTRQYGIGRILYFEPSASNFPTISPPEYLKHILDQGVIHLITGHHKFGLHAMARRPCRYFSMVRDPIQRALSDYYYAFTYQHHRLREPIVSGELTVAEFLTDSRYGMSGEQTLMLSGDCPFDDGYVETAIENVRTSFLVVGTAERFDQSILLMAKYLGWHPPMFVRRNVTPLHRTERERRDAMVSEARAAYSEHFSGDYQVYAAVDRLLSARIREEGEPFQRALGAFLEIQQDISAQSGDLVFEEYDVESDEPLPQFAARYVGSGPYRAILDYLGTEPTVKTACNYVGEVERLEKGVITGWAVDLSLSQPINITIRRGNRALGQARCDIARPDPQLKDFPRTDIGFRFERDGLSGDPRDYSVCFEDTSIELNRAPGTGR